MKIYVLFIDWYLNEKFNRQHFLRLKPKQLDDKIKCKYFFKINNRSIPIFAILYGRQALLIIKLTDCDPELKFHWWVHDILHISMSSLFSKIFDKLKIKKKKMPIHNPLKYTGNQSLKDKLYGRLLLFRIFVNKIIVQTNRIELLNN